MKIVVCAKQVPDTTEVKLDPKTNTLIRDGVPSIINPDDKAGLEAALRRRLRQAPSRTFLIYHPALGYFARTFGLRQLSVEQDGKEASPRRVAELVGQCRRDSVRVVFIQKEYSGETARRIAEATGARVAVINPLSYQWEEELEHIVEELCR